MNILLKFVRSSVLFTADALINTGTFLECYVVKRKAEYRMAERNHEMHQMVIPVAGVTFEGRQEVIRDLVNELPVSFVPVSARQYPFRIQVRIGNSVVGYVPDKKFNSVAGSFYELWSRGYVITAASYRKVIGSKGLFGLRIVCNVVR